MPTMLGLTNETQAQGQMNGDMTVHGGSEKKENKGSKRPTGRLSTISQRNLAAAHDSEALLWRAMTDTAEAALEYMADDCILVNPVVFGDSDPVVGKKEIKEAIKDGTQYTSYRLHSETFQVVEVGLMALSTIYHVTLFRHDGSKTEQVECLGSSVWRQTAGADWVLCSQMLAYAD